MNQDETPLKSLILQINLQSTASFSEKFMNARHERNAVLSDAVGERLRKTKN